MATADKTILFEVRAPIVVPPGGGGGGGPLPNAPAWVAQLGLQVGHWSPFTLNLLDAPDVNPARDPLLNPGTDPRGAPWSAASGQQAVLSVWNGGVAVPANRYGTHGALLLYGGGHNGYHGSEVYALDMGLRLFKRLNNPYNMAVGAPYPTGMYPDGSAVPPHTYDAMSYDPTTDSLVHVSGSPDPVPSGSRVAVSSMFSLTTKSWRRGPLNPRGGHKAGQCSAYDSKNNCVWFFNFPGSSSFDLERLYDIAVPNGDGTSGKYALALSGLPTAFGMSIDGAMAFDHVSNLLVVTNFRSSNNKTVRCFDVTNPAAVTRFLPVVSGGGPVLDSANGWEYCAARNSFIYYADNNMSDVWELRKPTGNLQTETWQWVKLTSPANTYTPPAPLYTNGIYSKFNVIEYADMALAVLVTDNTRPGYVMRLT